jgi:hypothetical protein
MAWEEVSNIKTKNYMDPTISIGQFHIHYSSVFEKLSDLKKYKRVKYYVDKDTLKIGFEFTNDQKSGVALFRKSDGGGACRSSCNELNSRYEWIKSISYLKNSKARKFIATKEGKIWSIQLMPGFEYKCKRDQINEIDARSIGIYRYLRNEEVVYIGKGDIKRRLQEEQRKKWDFEIIEWSVLAEESDQYRWEKWWLDFYQEYNGGKLPIYNSISGRSE